jgi:hypothetical protein
VFEIAGCASFHMAHVLRKRRRIAKENDKTLKVAAWFLKSGVNHEQQPPHVQISSLQRKPPI